jgi:hypothetical protein
MTTNFAGAVLLNAARPIAPAPVRTTSVRKAGHGFRDHGGPRATKEYFCECGFEEGNSPTLAEARQVHQNHLKGN